MGVRGEEFCFLERLSAIILELPTRLRWKRNFDPRLSDKDLSGRIEGTANESSLSQSPQLLPRHEDLAWDFPGRRTLTPNLLTAEASYIHNLNKNLSETTIRPNFLQCYKNCIYKAQATSHKP